MGFCQEELRLFPYYENTGAFVFRFSSSINPYNIPVTPYYSYIHLPKQQRQNALKVPPHKDVNMN